MIDVLSTLPRKTAFNVATVLLHSIRRQQTEAMTCMMVSNPASKARTRKFWSTPPAWHVVDSMSSPQAISANASMTFDRFAALGASCLVNVRFAAAVHVRALQKASISAE